VSEGVDLSAGAGVSEGMYGVGEGQGCQIEKLKIGKLFVEIGKNRKIFF
jgi:hypothetical protein